MESARTNHRYFFAATDGIVKGFRLPALCALIAFFAVSMVPGTTQFALAQDIFGRIAGTITDQSGAVVANAKVTIINEATLVRRNVTAEKNGYFVADELPAGTYTVTAEQTGFKTITKRGNVLTAGGRLTVDLGLEVGTATETVTVTAVGDTVNTTSGEISTTITQRQVLDMALNQRHYESLVGLVPGAALQGSGTNPASLTISYNNSVADIDGQRLDGQNWSVDGGFNLDSGSNNSTFNQVGIDFIQEVDVQASNYDAEFGRSASATINVVTKSGGNRYHGGGFEFVQNNTFNAENPGTKLTSPTATGYKAVPPFHFNDFGWDLGGPIPYIQPKGKLFFFAGQEWKKFRGVYPGLTAASVQEIFPTAAEVAGDFTDLIGPLATTPPTTGLLKLQTPAVIPASCGGVLYTAPNVINPACITGDGAAFAALYSSAAKLSVSGALPTSTNSKLSFNLPNPLNLREDIIRIDEHANDRHSFYFRYIHDNVQIYNPYGTFAPTPLSNDIPVDPDLRNRPGYNYQIGWTYAISPTLINSVKFNADWHKQRTPVQGTAWEKTGYGFKFIPPLGNPAQFPNGLPAIAFTGVAGFPTTGPAGVNGPATNFLASPTTDINPSDNVSWVKHSHTIKFGVDFARNRKTQNSRTSYDGTLNFSTNAGATTVPNTTGAAGKTGSNTTGDPFADALLGNFNTLGQNSAVTTGQFRFNDLEAYVQDSWKVTRKFSLVLGVRYIHTTPTYAQGNNMTNFNPFAFDTSLEPTFTGGLSSGSINPASPGLCSGPLVNVVGTPTLKIECNGLQRPGQVPSDQAKNVPVTSADPQLLAAINNGAARGFYHPENLLAPRVGFSYAPFSDGKTVIRGGFGIFYDKPEGNLLGLGINSQGYPPWAQSASISGTNASLSQFDSAQGAGTVQAPSTFALNGVDPHLVVARSYQYSLGVQRELPDGILVQAAYVGNVGRHILRAPSFNNATWTAQGNIPVSPNPNTEACPSGINAAAYQCSGGFAPAGLSKDQIRPFLGYAAIQMALGDVNSNYNALQLSLTKRAGILTAMVSYTFSKTLGDGGGAGDAYNENPEQECPFTCLVSTAANPVLVNGGTTSVAGGTQTGGVVESWKRFDYGKVSFDATHILSTSFTVESPWGRHLTGVGGAAVKGWSLSALMHYQSGSPLTATATAGVGLSGQNVNRRATIVAGQSIGFTGGTCGNVVGGIVVAKCWLNPNAFTATSPLGAGDAPVSDIIGPNFYQWDLSVRKTFRLPYREGLSLQFQADAFNAFNRANWNNPTVNNAGSSNFGQITGSLPGRILQFGGKFNF
ncbi:MAG TPA: TonB-dependent receptor [Candidatus Acidoferrum sp.]|nr:TonB-dependent receptor [Candidatus Acidoferrum sp.]